PAKTRRYDAAERRRRAAIERAHTRGAILDGAQTLFLRDGYAASSMASIAAAASVSAQTIYLAVGSKADVLRAVIARAVLDDAAAHELTELPWVARLAAEPDPVEQLRLLTAELVALAQRAGPLWALLADAARHDRALIADVHEHEAGRLRDQRRLLELIHGLAVPLERAVDIVGGFARPDLWQTFVVDRGWSPREVEDLLFSTLRHLLLTPPRE
ncbi:MAG TPA: TetR family transcriptional regulator, partial [Microbacterium sp.]|nr:TetR family transcriptional regulator [Microbacterium sp.]